MSQNCDCDCQSKECVMLPIRGIGLAVDKSTLIDTGCNCADYSLEEQWTGQRWVDGKKIYRKVLILDQLPSVLPGHQAEVYPMPISGLDAVIRLEGIATTPEPYSESFNLNFGAPDLPTGIAISYVRNSQSLAVRCGIDRTNSSAMCIIEYTCTDR